jgi:hypothetical protein
MIFFSSHCILVGSPEVSIPVTTRERVGRTIGCRPMERKSKMSKNMSDGSARIYQFPRGGRAALGGRHNGAGESTRQSTPPVQTSICAGSWYHEEAIQEAKPAWER